MLALMNSPAFLKRILTTGSTALYRSRKAVIKYYPHYSNSKMTSTQSGVVIMFQIRKVEKSDLAELMLLFTKCFEDDLYYAKLFPNQSARASEMKKAFEKPIGYCFEDDGAYGVYDNDTLIAFILFFDYQKAKNTDQSMFEKIFKGNNKNIPLPYKTKIHDRIDCLGRRIVYLLSMGVSKEYRKKGIASELIDFMIRNHPNDYLVGDVSNSSSMAIYEHRDFSVEKLDDDYYFIKHDPKYSLTQLFFAGQERIKVALTDEKMIQQITNSETISLERATIEGYRVEDGNHMYPYGSFIKSPSDKCEAWLADMDYLQLLSLQRYLNLTCHIEDYCDIEGGGQYLIYRRTVDGSSPKLWNDKLEEMIKSRENEWKVIPDTQILIPIEYDDIKLIKASSRNFDATINAFLHYLDYRTHYESGIPKGTTEQSRFSFKNRIERYYLGKIVIKITEESDHDNYDSIGEIIGAPAEVDLIISIDKESNCGVFTIISNSAPFLLSHFMDNVIRNHIYMLDDNNEFVSLFNTLEKYGIRKRGTSKIFATIPQSKNCLTNAQIASLIMSETIYSSDEDLGAVIDEEILSISESSKGMGQYDRAFVCVHTNVFIQFCENFHATVMARLHEEAITFFYIELLVLEEAAIQILEHNIVACLSEVKAMSPKKFLARTLHIHRQYAKTIEFWDIQVKYPSSRKSVSMIRTAFKINEQLERLNRDSEELKIVFEAQRDIMDRTEASMLNYIILFLTLIQGLSIVAPALFFGDEFISPNKIIGSTMIVTIVVLYGLLKRIRRK